VTNPEPKPHGRRPIAQLLREVYDATDPDEGRRRLRPFYDHRRRSDVAELERLGRTIRRWEHQILAWHRTGLTN
jgi:hypothetical protein